MAFGKRKREVKSPSMKTKRSIDDIGEYEVIDWLMRGGGKNIGLTYWVNENPYLDGNDIPTVSVNVGISTNVKSNRIANPLYRKFMKVNPGHKYSDDWGKHNAIKGGIIFYEVDGEKSPGGNPGSIRYVTRCLKEQGDYDPTDDPMEIPYELMMIQEYSEEPGIISDILLSPIFEGFDNCRLHIHARHDPYDLRIEYPMEPVAFRFEGPMAGMLKDLYLLDTETEYGKYEPNSVMQEIEYLEYIDDQRQMPNVRFGNRKIGRNL